MDKNGTLVINNFQQGVANSPILGFARMNNAEIFEKEGVARMQYGASLSFYTASLPVAMVEDLLGNQYVGCAGGHFYKNGTLINTSSSGICDMAVISNNENQFYTAVTGTAVVGDTYTNSGITYTVVDTSISGGSGTMSIIGKGTPSPSATLTKATGSGDATITLGTPLTTATNIEYILVTRADNVFNIYGPTWSGSAEFVVVQTGLQTGAYKAIVTGIDTDIASQSMIYIGNGNKIATIKNFVSNYPGLGPSYSFNSTALTLEPKYWAYSINQLGKFLSIGLVPQFSNTFDNITKKFSGLILWDRTSPTFNLPVFYKENGITSQMQLQNTIYFAVGNRGRIEFTDGTYFRKVKRIPFCFNRQFGSYAFIYPNAITLHNGEIVVGVSGQDIDANYGVYTMHIDPSQLIYQMTNYPINMRNTISTGNNGTTQLLKVGFLYSTGADVLYIGWQDGSSYGVDVISYPTATTEIQSQYYSIGSELNKVTFKRMEISCTAPLISGQSISISYKQNLNDTVWTPIGTYTSTDFGIANSINRSANLARLIDIQFKITMTQPSTVPFGSNIELQSVTFYQSEK